MVAKVEQSSSKSQQENIKFKMSRIQTARRGRNREWRREALRTNRSEPNRYELCELIDQIEKLIDRRERQMAIKRGRLIALRISHRVLVNRLMSITRQEEEAGSRTSSQTVASGSVRPGDSATESDSSADSGSSVSERL